MKEVNSFLDYIKYEKRYSENTVLGYSNDLEQFFLFSSDRFGDTDLNQINRSMVRSWIVHLVQNNAAPSTVRRKVSSLQSFFKFLRKKNIVAHNPTNALQLPKKGEKVPTFIKMGEMHLVLEGVQDIHEDTEYNSVLEKAILYVLYGTGMRRGEIINLKLSDFKSYENSLSVIGKGNKQRLIPLSDELTSIINYYISRRSLIEIKCNEQFLFLTSSGAKLYPGFVHRTIKKYLDNEVHAEKISPHTLRHTFASHLSQNGADLNAIKSLLGHSSLSSTQVYTHHSIEGLKKIYSASHPKSD